MKKWFTALIVSSVCLLGACGGEENERQENQEENTKDTSDDSLEVAVIPAQSSGEMATGLDKLENTLNEQMEQTVEVEHYPNYNAVVEALNYGHIDLAYLGPLTYVVAHEVSGAEAIITQEIDGTPYYHSYILTHADSPWENLDDLLEDSEEVDFAFGSISSTSGSLIPGLELRERGVFNSEDDHDFSTVRYTGSHDVTATAIASKEVDAGAIDSSIFHELVSDGTIDESQFKKIWQSEQLYQYPWAVPADMDDEIKEDLQDAFTNIEDQEILDIFGGASAFVKTDHSHYESIRKAAEDFGMLNTDSLD
ncbi:phosphate/phosphite/phosphonate ABC transporter substrate-binding protein [Alteribacillus iranensis]|uniref:Phosphonate transport system substrate-binding protein n=1 Tax=Alteribacillus iranensis TaxID=930128 RepID=A0A1I2DPK3_9BACI|nr:phosphate/phosphite/phosphonate ABC transporter substrate-binding protein [Alteribacillus iranensis]SFE82552.1 phosphonate transport system substrate-binding protein [Alteribacillus iranensis]